MKKLMSIIVLMVLLFAMVSCSAKSVDGDQTTLEDIKNTTSTTNPTTTTESTTQDKLLEITVNVFDPEQEPKDLSDEQKKYGFISKKLDGDNAIYTISKSNYSKWLNHIDKTAKNLLEKELPKDKSIKGIKKVTYNEEMTDIEIIVDSKKFDKSNYSNAKLTVGLTLEYYHQWYGYSGSYNIVIKDETGKEL